MTTARIIYLIFLVLGILMPMPHYWLFFRTHGGLADFLDAVSVNQATAAMAMSVLVTGAAFTVFVTAECIARRDRIAWVAAPVTCLLGPSVGVPLYLFLRSRPVH